jgi:hypothetical protein
MRSKGDWDSLGAVTTVADAIHLRIRLAKIYNV